MTYRKLLSSSVAEGSSFKMKSVVRAEDGTALSDSNIESLTLTLYEESTGAIINSKHAVDILNTGGGTVDASGNLTLLLGPSDNVLLTSGNSEVHIALFEWVFNSSASKGVYEVSFVVDKITNL